MEETGYDISPKIVEGDFVEMHLGGRGEDGRGQQKCKLFIIQEVSPKIPSVGNHHPSIGLEPRKALLFRLFVGLNLCRSAGI